MMAVLRSVKFQDGAGLQAEPLRFPAAQLEDRACVAPAREAPRAQVRLDVEHAKVFVEEHRVDREAHEAGVDRGRRLQQEAFTGRQPAAPHQASEARERPVGDSAMLTDELTALTFYVQPAYVHNSSFEDGGLAVHAR
jgi:hypothetical protein